MAKIISFYGSPSSGKTSLALKTAMEIYCETKDEKVVFLSPDLNVPSIGLLFPNYNPDDICSLGQILDNTDITADTVLENAVTVKSMKDFICLGFKAGDNKFSFPVTTEDKVSDLFKILSEIAGYIVVDCTADETDSISGRAIANADIIIRVISPDTKGMAWYSSHKGIKDTAETEVFNIVNVTDKDLFYPVEEICDKVDSVLAVIPYSKNLKQQMLDGRMTERLNERPYNKKLRFLTEKILI